MIKRWNALRESTRFLITIAILVIGFTLWNHFFLLRSDWLTSFWGAMAAVGSGLMYGIYRSIRTKEKAERARLESRAAFHITQDGIDDWRKHR